LIVVEDANFFLDITAQTSFITRASTFELLLNRTRPNPALVPVEAGSKKLRISVAAGVTIALPLSSVGNPVGGGMPDSEWQALYRAALSESDQRQLYYKIEAARRAIHDRLEQLDSSGDTREREQLDRALHALFTLPGRKRSA
jgi:hypothetical protein